MIYRNHDIVTRAVGIKQFKEGGGVVFAFEGGEEGFGFLAKAGFFGGILHLPGEEEIGPVDVWR